MRKILALFVFVVAAFIFNCSPVMYRHTYTNVPAFNGVTKLTIPIYVDKTFSEEDRLSIDNSVNQWNYVLNRQIVLKIVTFNFDMEPDVLVQAQSGQAFLFLKVDSHTPGVPDKVPEEQCRHIKGCTVTIAWADKIGGNVVKVVRDRTTADDLQYVMLHEIGHLLRLTHSTETNTLMFDKYSKFSYLCIDYDAVSRVAKEYNLDVHQMNYCASKY